MPLNIDSDFYAIGTGNKDGFPAVELDFSTGFCWIPIFSSYENAKRYVYLRYPDMEKSIFKLPKANFGGKIIQAGLIKTARIACSKHKQIKYFVVDHPGKKGNAELLDIKDVVEMGDRQNKERQQKNELFSFLDKQN